MFADFYTVAARTGGEGSGMMGISLILVERSRAGVSTREMDCMGAKGSGTAFVEFDNVRVPKTNYIGDVTCLLRNFITERLGIALQVCIQYACMCVRVYVCMYVGASIISLYNIYIFGIHPIR
jgi:alkylation response protein AidB-like acyl-CoA dehydrogenase